VIFSNNSPPDKLEYIRDIRLSPETLKKNESGKNGIGIAGGQHITKSQGRKRLKQMKN
jgi:hypothetical protein